MRLLAIVCILAFFGATLWQTCQIASFYANQEEIIESHCINKNKPELNCKGQCYLKEQLLSGNVNQTEKNFQSQVIILFQGFFEDSENVNYNYDSIFIDFNFVFSPLLKGNLPLIEHPPECVS